MKSLLEASSQTKQHIPIFIAVTVATFIPNWKRKKNLARIFCRFFFFFFFFSVSLLLSKLYNSLQLLMWSKSAGRRFEFQPRTDLSQNFNRKNCNYYHWRGLRLLLFPGSNVYGLCMGRLAYGKSDISCSIVTPQAKIPGQPNRLYSICNRRHWIYLRLVCEWQTQSDLLLRGFIWLQFCKIVTFWSQRLLEIGTGRYRSSL